MKDSQQAADPGEMLAAVRVNWRLWTILQAELLDPHCPVPDDVRGNVLSLAQFVDRQSLDIIAEPKAGKLDVLISINRELAGGLYSQPTAGGGEAEGSTTGGSHEGHDDAQQHRGASALTVSA